jgi:hypothetical protein
MLQGYSKREISKADMEKKVEAYKTLNQVLVKANSEFMNSLNNILIEKEVQLEQLKEKLQKDNDNAVEEDNIRLIFLGGYVQCLKDILNAKKTTQS